MFFMQKASQESLHALETSTAFNSIICSYPNKPETSLKKKEEKKTRPTIQPHTPNKKKKKHNLGYSQFLV